MTIVPDRTRQPEIQKIADIKMPCAKLSKLDNGIPVDIIDLGDQDVCRIDIVTEGGQCDESVPLECETAASLIREGTTSTSAQTIAEQLDYYRSWMGTDTYSHASVITLYCINRYLDRTVPVLIDMIRHPLYEEKELKRIKTIAKNRLLTELEKVAYLSMRELQKQYFGPAHRLGIAPTAELIDSLQREHLMQFHDKWYNPANLTIIVSGKITNQLMETLNRHFGTWQDDSPHTESASDMPDGKFCPFETVIDKPHAMQSSVRMAIPAPPRNHPDYIPLRILCMALGGYFGSRLMTNIREEKGYTYGIYASLLGHRNTSYISIASQCDNAYTRSVIHEIKNEIDRLKQSPMPDDELGRVRSYMLGDLSKTLDTPFTIADYHISMLSNNITRDYFNSQIKWINEITPATLREMACKYLDHDNALTVIAGNKDKIR